MDRRAFLASGAVLALPRVAFSQNKVNRLRLAPAKQSLVGAQHPATDVWAYNGTVPGPELRFKQGERLRIEVENALEVATTVHWHGIRLPNAMDGVPGVTQNPIPKGGRFLYEFDLPDAGTYWYHPHLGSPEQAGRGLYAPLIVEERKPPAVDRDVTWVLSDWRLDREARIVPDFMSPMDASHAGRIGNTVTVNGSVRESFPLGQGERLRLRLINASNARIYGLRFEGHDPWIIAFDGQPIEPHRLADERVVLGPAQRADLILDCAAEPGSRHRVVDDFYPRRAYRLLDLVYEGVRRRRDFAPIEKLAANPIPQPDLGRAERHRIVFGGGMMGAMPDQREHRGVFWSINGKALAEQHHDHAPLVTFKRGTSCVMELVNETAWHHPIHLHGHVFRVLTRNGKPVAESGDTTLIDPRSRAEIAFVADNPGNWMLHCHVLEHQASGMMALVRVAG